MSATRQKIRHAAPKRSGGNWIWIAAIAVVVVVAVVAIVASRSSSTGATSTEFSDTVTVSGAALPQAPENGGADSGVGKVAPKVSGEAPSGGKVTVGPDGKPTMVFVVAHWCPHCNRELPLLAQWQKDGMFDGVDVQVISTGQNESRANWPPSAWLKDKGLKANVELSDDADQTAAAAYGTTGYPFMVALDKDGKVVARASGEQPEAVVDKLVLAAKTGKPIGQSSSSSEQSSAG